MNNQKSRENATLQYVMYIQPAPSMTSLVCNDPSKMACSAPPTL